MEHLTFTQQFLMALAHGGPPTLAAILTYAGLRRHITVKLNGSLDDKIREAVRAALESGMNLK